MHLNTTDLFYSRTAQELALSRTKRVRFRRGVIVSEQKRDYRLRTKKLRKKLRDPCWFLVLQPVTGLREGEEFAVGAVAQAFVSHFRHEEPVALSPQNACGHTHSAVRKREAITHRGAIPVDHRPEGAGLRPSCTILSKVLGRKSAGAAGTAECSRPHTEVESRKQRFGQPRNLKEKDVPASQCLRKPHIDVAAHDRRMRYVQDDKFFDTPGMQQSGAPGNGQIGR